MAQVNGMKPEGELEVWAVLAAYANLARHNVHVLLNSVAGKMGLEGVPEGEVSFNKPKEGKVYPVLELLQAAYAGGQENRLGAVGDLTRAIRGVESGLRFLGLFDTAQAEGRSDARKTAIPQEYWEVLYGRSKGDNKAGQRPPEKVAEKGALQAGLLGLLESERHHASHACHAAIQVDEDLVCLLERMYEAAIRKVKQLPDFCDEKTKQALFERLVPKRKNGFIEDNRLFVCGGEAGGKVFTPFGRQFFLCLFLTRAEGHGFLEAMDRVMPKPWRRREALKAEERRALRVVLTYFGLVLPRMPIWTAPLSDEALALDMLNELTRCPATLYAQLSETDRRDYRVSAKEGWGEDEAEVNEAPGEAMVPLIRKRDRFAELMLDYMGRRLEGMGSVDGGGAPGLEQKAGGKEGRGATGSGPEKLGFAVDLGDFYFRVYDKPFYRGGFEKRRLKKKILAYAHVDQREAWVKSEGWTALELDAVPAGQGAPYIVKTQPHLHLPVWRYGMRALPDGNIALGVFEAGGSPYPEVVPDTAKGGFRCVPASSVPEGTGGLGAKREFVLSRHALPLFCFYDQIQRAWRDEKEQVEKGEPVGSLLVAYAALFDRVMDEILKGEAGVLGYRCVNDLNELDARLREHFVRDSLTIRACDLPAVLLRYLCVDSRKPVEGGERGGEGQGQGDTERGSALGRALNTVKIFLDENARLLAQLKAAESPEQKDRRTWVGGRKYRPLKAGRLADFLARDMLRLQPVLCKAGQEAAGGGGLGKANSLYFAELQELLAFYGRNVEVLPKFCQHPQVGLIGGRNPHPFLKKVFERAGENPCVTVAGFYRIYLEERAGYLTGIQEELKKGLGAALQQLHGEGLRWLSVKERPEGEAAVFEYVRSLRRLPINLPINLPVDLLVAPCLLLLEKRGVMIGAENEGGQRNGMFIIQEYFREVLEDGHSPMFGLGRYYPVLDQWWQQWKQGDSGGGKREEREQQGGKGQKGEKGKKYFMRLAGEGANVFGKEERAALRVWLGKGKKAGDKVEQNEGGEEAQVEQKKRRAAFRRFVEAESALRQVRGQDQVLFMAAQDLLKGADRDFGERFRALKLKGMSRRLLDMQVPYEMVLHEKTVFCGQIRIGQIGRFRHLMKDRRLKKLFAYYGAERIEYGALQRELETYQRCRIEVFQRILAFEMQMLKTNPELLQGNEKGFVEHRKILEKYFERHGGDFGDTKIMFGLLRNAFAHNEYPELSKLNGSVVVWREGAYCVAEWLKKKVFELYPLTVDCAVKARPGGRPALG